MSDARARFAEGVARGWGRVRTPVTVAWLTVGVLAAATAAAVGSDWAKQWWPDASWRGVLFFTALLITVAQALVVQLSAALRVRRVRQMEGLEADASRIAQGVLRAVRAQTRLGWETIGVEIFVVERRLWRTPELRLVARQRLGARRLGSVVRWVPGKGVPGRCWATSQVEWVDLVQRFGGFYLAALRWGELADSERHDVRTRWAGQPAAERLGLSFEELLEIVDDEVVVAYPVRRSETDPHVLGVLVVTGPAGSQRKLTTVEVQDVCLAAARAFADRLL
jgi:hypothetical protein